jgi:hypothetical protein
MRVQQRVVTVIFCGELGGVGIVSIEVEVEGLSFEVILLILARGGLSVMSIYPVLSSRIVGWSLFLDIWVLMALV